jgi:hypothetical protein
MASRAFDQWLWTIPKRVVLITANVAVPTGTTPVLQKYNYPVLGSGGRTLSAATVGTTPLGFPQNYQSGSEGIFSVARTGTGLWTITLQDNYQRLLIAFGSLSIASTAVHNIVEVAENPTITSMSSANGSVVGFKLLSATNTLADPTADASTVVRLVMLFADATEP